MTNFSSMKVFFMGKVVRIYPGDTYSKEGRIVDINEKGVTFRITSSQANAFSVGKLHFEAWKSLSFELVND